MNQLSSAEKTAFASPVARRKRAQLHWSIAGTAVIALTYAFGLVLQSRGWVTYQFPQTILWCTIPYVFVAQWLYGGASVPLTERIGLLVVTTGAPFLLTPLGFALLQQPYSRGAILLVYAATFAWHAWGERRQRGLHHPRLAEFDPEIGARLRELTGQDGAPSLTVELVPLPSHTQDMSAALSALDGVVVDTRIPVTASRTEMLSRLKLAHVRLYSVDALAEMITGRKMPGLAENELWQLDGKPAYDIVKRVIDVTVVVLFAPIWLLVCCGVAAGVAMDSRGPVLYRQERVGLNGRRFNLWKFRSMLHELQIGAPQFAQTRDPRITRFGKLIRRTRLDELPQLWNVLRGDMSLIGPRPEQTRFVEEFATRIPSYSYRHLVRPGLTGWAQVLQGYAGDESSSAVKLSYDLYYVSHYSVSLDLLIVYKTIKIFFTGFGAR